MLQGHRPIAQPRYAGWRRKQQFDHLPDDFGEQLADHLSFAEPVVSA